ncbi:MAG: hypothetical protein QM770_16370 [Tepidisphaeraceae bacterium]
MSPRPCAAPSYFLLAERNDAVVHGDSFVVGLTDADLIQHARDLIQLGPDSAGSPILFADIAEGADGINRDLLKPGAPQWSWHVTSVGGFSDFGIELLDGWPSFVESDVPGWIRNTNPTQAPPPAPQTGQIGFWSYTVVKELPSDYPETIPVIPLPATVPVTVGLMALTVMNPRFRRAIMR